jgi:protein TonB
MNGRLKFTIYHGLAASLAVHAALGLPFVALSLASPPDEPPTLVIELQGAVAESQTEQKILQETKGEEKQEEVDAAKPAQATDAPPHPDDQPPEATESEKEMPLPSAPSQAEPTPAATAKSGSAGASNITGAEVQQNAQTIKSKQDETSRIRDYLKLLGKKIQANLPDEERGATMVVSFAILSDGQIRQEALKIVESSGQPRLDASALKTIRASAPFAPPPREMTVSIVVDFDRKHSRR